MEGFYYFKKFIYLVFGFDDANQFFPGKLLYCIDGLYPVFVEGSEVTTIEEFAGQEVKLAERRWNPELNGEGEILELGRKVRIAVVGINDSGERCQKPSGIFCKIDYLTMMQLITLFKLFDRYLPGPVIQDESGLENGAGAEIERLISESFADIGAYFADMVAEFLMEEPFIIAAVIFR